MNKNTYQTVKLDKGEMHIYDFGAVKLHAYQTNDPIDDEVFLVEKAGQLINGIDSYDAAISEVHHRQKADSPSGTALMAAERILATVSRKKGLQIGNPDGRIDPGKLAVSSMRVGSVPGIHTLTIDGAADTITITHTARSREGFAEGAIKAAAWICRQKAGLYTMDDFINDMLGGRL